jgi:hypothetical protein
MHVCQYYWDDDMQLQTAMKQERWKHKVATTTNHNSTINEWAMIDLERG